MERELNKLSQELQGASEKKQQLQLAKPDLQNIAAKSVVTVRFQYDWSVILFGTGCTLASGQTVTASRLSVCSSVLSSLLSQK